MDTRGINVVVPRRDVRVFGGHGVEGALPQISGEREDVGLVHEVEPLRLTASRQVECVPHAALHTHARVHRTLGRDLVRGVLAQESTFAGVGAFGVLAHHDHVHAVVQRARAGQKRTVIHIEIERKPHLQQQPALENPGRNVGRPYRAEQNRVQPS